MPDTPLTTGLHHVTNICTDMERTRAFCEEVLGFHTVKMTENYDDPGTPHYYFSATPEGEPGMTVTYLRVSELAGSARPRGVPPLRARRRG